MWRSYDPSIIDAELKTLADHGLTMTRSFFYWPDFMPAPDQIDEAMVARFADFLDRHQAHGLTTIPTFIVGHMSGENWDPAWRAGRDLYSDVYMVGRQAWFAAEMTRRFTHHRAVAGWLVSNEMPLYGGANTDHHTVEAWARLIRDAVRAAGGHQPFSLGDGAWGIEVRGHDNGFRLTDIAPLVDFLGPHVYPVGDDPVRQKYAAALDCELAGSFGKPVIMEEFGVSSDFAAEDNAASYYRHVLWSTLLAGATGWIGWNNTDFALTTQDPYRHHSFELNFGLTDATGRPKKTLAEMRAFKQALDAIGFASLQREDTDTAIIVSSYLDTQYPFTSPDTHQAVARSLTQGYISARLADLAPALTRETTGIDPTARLYLAPSVKQVLATTADAIEELARAGATVYVSYSPGDVAWHRGPSFGRMNSLFGVTHQLDVGLNDYIDDDEVELTFTRDFGGLTRGATMRWRAAGSAHSRAYLPVIPAEAEVIATDAHGRPAILRRALGTGGSADTGSADTGSSTGTGSGSAGASDRAGDIIFCTYPLEHMASVTPRVNPDATVTLYSVRGEHAGVRRPVTVDDPRVACDTLVREDGARFAVLASHAAEPLDVKPVLADGLTLATLDGEDVNGAVTLGPFGVRVLRL
jgi:endo-1,4-beta-mannosidase